MGVELIAKDKNEKFQYEGRCKLMLDSISRLLLVEPFNEEFKMISAMFKCEFVAQKNILFVFAEYDFQDFGLVFDDSNKCNKIYGLLVKKGATPGNAELIQQRFLPPLFSEISRNIQTCHKMCQIIANWIEQHNDNEKERLVQLLKDDNVFDLIFRNTNIFGAQGDVNDKNEKRADQDVLRRSLRKRRWMSYKCQDIRQHFLNESVNNETDENKRPPSKKSRHQSKIIRSPNFEIYDYERKGIKRSKLVVYASTDKILCYEYYWNNLVQMYACGRCRKKKQVWAKLMKCRDGKKCVKLLSSKHICKPRKYEPEKYKIVNEQIIESPNFKIIDYEQCGIKKSKLFIFSKEDRNLCHEYYWDNGCKLYECCGCEIKNKRVSADVLEKNGKKYIELRITQHICELRKYQPEKYLIDPSKEVVENANFSLFNYTQRNVTKKTLVVFPESDNRKFCYEYYWCKTENRFVCGICSGKKYVYANICKNADGEDYVKLSKNQHVCEPRIFKESNYKSDAILRQPDYNFIEENIRGVSKRNLLIFDSTNKELSYHFSYWPSIKEYRCTNCNKKKFHFYANLNTDKEENEYVTVKNCEHVCQPLNHQAYSAKIIKQPYYQIVEHMVRQKPIKKLIVFADNDKKMCYEYTWEKKRKICICSPCRRYGKTHTYAKVIQNGDGEEFVELSKNEHSCKPIKFSASKYIAKKHVF